MTVLEATSFRPQEALSVRTVNHGIDRVRAAFDEESLVAGAGLVLVATVVSRLGLEALVNSTVRLVGRVGGSRPGRKVLTLVHAMAAGANCIDDADRLRAGATGGVLGHRVMAPSTLGTFLRSFSFGHVRQLEAAGEFATYVSRIREDTTVENGLALWIVADNLLKGAALNTVQIAETIVNRKLLPNAA